VAAPTTTLTLRSRVTAPSAKRTTTRSRNDVSTNCQVISKACASSQRPPGSPAGAGGPLLIQLTGAALAAATLGGFVLSRTVGIFGFVEHGWQPAPEALLSVLTESAVVILIGWAWVQGQRGKNLRVPGVS